MSTFYLDVEPDPEYIREWEANLKARVLHERGLSFRAISVAIEEFMGVPRTAEAWRWKLQEMGCARRAPRGVHAKGGARV
jgi:hypothetical protein